MAGISQYSKRIMVSLKNKDALLNISVKNQDGQEGTSCKSRSMEKI